jgi:ATP-dependent DNA helicase RecG
MNALLPDPDFSIKLQSKKRFFQGEFLDIKGLKRLVKTGESDRVEFKKTTGQRTVAAKTICAFLNNKGGQVIFGVTDGGEIAGQDSGKRTLEELSLEFNRIDP